MPTLRPVSSFRLALGFLIPTGWEGSRYLSRSFNKGLENPRGGYIGFSRWMCVIQGVDDVLRVSSQRAAFPCASHISMRSMSSDQYAIISGDMRLSSSEESEEAEEAVREAARVASSRTDIRGRSQDAVRPDFPAVARSLMNIPPIPRSCFGLVIGMAEFMLLEP